jgi:hypothetical protein
MWRRPIEIRGSAGVLTMRQATDLAILASVRRRAQRDAAGPLGESADRPRLPAVRQHRVPVAPVRA